MNRTVLRARSVAGLLTGALLLSVIPVGAGSAGGQVSTAAPTLTTAAKKPGPGRAISTRRAGRTSRVAGARVARVLRYTTTSVRGRTVPATGLVLVPRGRPPKRGWPIAVYGHMTTGAADRCAPTNGRPGHDELKRMQQGDAITRRLLAAGVVVLRPDFEGLGVPGPHPYLRGTSLGTSMVDMVRAAKDVLPRMGKRWVVAGHSEGAVAALNAAALTQAPLPGMELAGVAAFTPVTQMEVLIQLLQDVPVAGPGIGVDTLVALAALILKGHAAEDPAFRRLLRNGGLSKKALELWPHLERRCLNGLMRADSWGGLAPAQILGHRGREASRRLRSSLAEQDVRHLRMPDVPVRIDLGLLDLVAPVVFPEALAQTYRSRGVDLTVGRWIADHSGVVTDAHAAGPAVAWMLARLRGR